jgi:hypothetical protein
LVKVSRDSASREGARVSSNAKFVNQRGQLPFQNSALSLASSFRMTCLI